MRAYLTEMFGGLIMFQKHLEHESLAHYEDGGLGGTIHHRCFITTVATWFPEN